MNKETIVEAVNLIDKFINSVKSGETYWIDQKGHGYTTDVGYGLEFWGQIRDYILENGLE